MDQQIKAEFTQNGFALEDEEDILQKCTTFCINFGVKPSELVSSWELYYLNMQLDGSKVQSSHMDGFRQHLQNEQKESFLKQETDLHFYSSNDIDMLLNDENESNEDKLLQTPVRQSVVSASQNTPEALSPLSVIKTPVTDRRLSNGKQRSTVLSSPGPITPFENRSSKCVLQFVFNKHILDSIVGQKAVPESEDDLIKRMQEAKRCSLQNLGISPSPGCRYMYDSIEGKFEYLEGKIKTFATALAAKEARNVFNHVAIASQESVFVVGLVCCDGEGHLNDKSVLLQGSVEYSGGQRVRLDLHKLAKFSLFPGQVIGVEGHNPSGHCLIASRVIDSFPVSNSLHPHDQDAPSAKRLAMDQASQMNSLPRTRKTISMLIAAGPFTTTDNLAFQPLTEFLVYAKKKQVNNLILMGPFVDSEHPQIKIGTVDKFYEEIFQEEVCARLRDYCEEMGPSAHVVLVPSTRDAHHDFLFPQPPFNVHAFDDPNQQITCVANPGLFCLDEITIGICTVDVLRHLSSEEISQIPEHSSNDRLARLSTHILSQRSFYPLFPAASGLPLDLSATPEALHMLSLPNIIILPSDLAPFVKVLQVGDDHKQTEPELLQNDSNGDHAKQSKCVCINPGRLAKGTNGGTFAELLNLEKDQNSTMQDVAQFFEDRTVVSIIRI
jgi:DNA polymerase alpha subunit B